MKQTSERLEFKDSGFLFMLLIGGSFVIVGLLIGGFFGCFVALLGLIVMIFAEIETTTFDKNLGHMTIKQHKPLIAKTKVVKHLIQDICGVEIQKMYGNESYLYRVCLVLESGKRRVPLTSGFSSGLKDKHKTAEVIATFLDIKNYGLDGCPTDNYSELQWETVEAEIAHWETAIKSDSNDADAHMRLALALISQDQVKNKQQAMGNLKQAEAIFKAQGYDDEAMQVGQLYGLAYWGMLGK